MVSRAMLDFYMLLCIFQCTKNWQFLIYFFLKISTLIFFVFSLNKLTDTDTFHHIEKLGPGYFLF